MSQVGRVVIGVSEQVMLRGTEYVESEMARELDAFGRKSGMTRISDARYVGRVDTPDGQPELVWPFYWYAAYEADFE